MNSEALNTKLCPECKEEKDLSEFYVYEIKGLKTITIPCKSCKSKYWGGFYDRARELFFEMYGKSCSCCGERNIEFLTVEHINGQKGKRKETAIRSLRNATKEYNPGVYRVLCMNCNHSLGKYGYCPHSK